jgi:integrase
MASVFDHEGRWNGKFKNERGTWTTRTCGGADKATSLRMAQAWEREALEVREGRTDPRAKKFQTAALRPIAEHVADFRAMLAGKGDTAKYVAEAASNIDRVISAMGAAVLADVGADGVRKVIAGLRDGGLSHRSCNAILHYMKGFMGWAEADGRIRHNDLRHVKPYNGATDIRVTRRDVSDDELGRIIAAAKAGGVAFGLSGEDRAIAYRLATGSGFRRGEIASLTKASFALEGDAPTVCVAAAYSKRRRRDTQPIDSALAAALKTWLAGKPDGGPVLPLTQRTAQMLAGDMRLAKAKWIKEARDAKQRRERRADAFLTPADGEGRIFDFHALRHLYISRVVSGGASVKTCQELARHSSPLLTLGRYAHVRLADLRKALPTLPTGDRPEALRMKATGTDGRPDQAPPGATPAQHSVREAVRNHAKGGDGGGILRLVGGDEQRPENVDSGDTMRGGAKSGGGKSEGRETIVCPKDYRLSG